MLSTYNPFSIQTVQSLCHHDLCLQRKQRGLISALFGGRLHSDYPVFFLCYTIIQNLETIIQIKISFLQTLHLKGINMHHDLQEREAFHFFLKDTNCFLGPSVYSYFSFPSARILLSNNFKLQKP